MKPNIRPLCSYGLTVLPSGFEQRPLRRLSRQILERIGEMVAVVQEVDAAGSLLEQKGQEGRIGLGRVAWDAGQDQVVRPVIGRLSPPGPHVVEGDPLGPGLEPAVGADRAMLFQQPFTMLGVGSTTGPAKTC